MSTSWRGLILFNFNQLHRQWTQKIFCRSQNLKHTGIQITEPSNFLKNDMINLIKIAKFITDRLN